MRWLIVIPAFLVLFPLFPPTTLAQALTITGAASPPPQRRSLGLSVLAESPAKAAVTRDRAQSTATPPAPSDSYHSDYEDLPPPASTRHGTLLAQPPPVPSAPASFSQRLKDIWHINVVYFKAMSTKFHDTHAGRRARARARVAVRELLERMTAVNREIWAADTAALAKNEWLFHDEQGKLAYMRRKAIENAEARRRSGGEPPARRIPGDHEFRAALERDREAFARDQEARLAQIKDRYWVVQTWIERKRGRRGGGPAPPPPGALEILRAGGARGS